MNNTSKSSTRQKALRDRRKAEGLKTLTRYVRPEWIPAIDALIEKLKQDDCTLCNGTGELDSGGVMPWGEPAMIPCEFEEFNK
jgi:hypothetical protein